MNESFWDRFPGTVGIGCIEMKDRAQARIARETRGMSTDRLIAYFREAARQFRAQTAAVYPAVRDSTMAVRETDLDHTTKRDA